MQIQVLPHYIDKETELAKVAQLVSGRGETWTHSGLILKTGLLPIVV